MAIISVCLSFSRASHEKFARFRQKHNSWYNVNDSKGSFKTQIDMIRSQNILRSLRKVLRKTDYYSGNKSSI